MNTAILYRWSLVLVIFHADVFSLGFLGRCCIVRVDKRGATRWQIAGALLLWWIRKVCGHAELHSGKDVGRNGSGPWTDPKRYACATMHCAAPLWARGRATLRAGAGVQLWQLPFGIWLSHRAVGGRCRGRGPRMGPSVELQARLTVLNKMNGPRATRIISIGGVSLAAGDRRDRL